MTCNLLQKSEEVLALEAKLEVFTAGAARKLQELETAANQQEMQIQELEAELAKEQQEV